MNDRWSTAFVAVSVALGESLEDALASLEGGGTTAVPGRRCAALLVALRSSSSSSQARRAHALAEVLAEAALGVQATVLS